MDVREKLALSVCNSTQKTNYKCDFKCEKKGKCAYCLVMAEQMIAHGVTVQEWISVKDRLPDVDGKYLVARAEGGRYSISVRKFRKEVPCWYTGYCGHWERRTNGITHWQPLPQPPKGE